MPTYFTGDIGADVSLNSVRYLIFVNVEFDTVECSNTPSFNANAPYLLSRLVIFRVVFEQRNHR